MRYHSLILAVLFLTACSDAQVSETPIADTQVADAQWDTEKETVNFNKCYEDSEPDEIQAQCGYIERCIAENNSTSSAMASCSVKGHELWDEKLNVEYKQIMSSAEEIFGTDASDALRKSQRSWLEYRDNECDAQVKRSGFIGAVRGAIYRSCLSDLTAERAIQFNKENVQISLKSDTPK